MEEKRALLKRYFGHAAFRGGQEALIDAIYEMVLIYRKAAM